MKISEFVKNISQVIEQELVKPTAIDNDPEQLIHLEHQILLAKLRKLNSQFKDSSVEATRATLTVYFNLLSEHSQNTDAGWFATPDAPVNRILYALRDMLNKVPQTRTYKEVVQAKRLESASLKEMSLQPKYYILSDDQTHLIDILDVLKRVSASDVQDKQKLISYVKGSPVELTENEKSRLINHSFEVKKFYTDLTAPKPQAYFIGRMMGAYFETPIKAKFQYLKQKMDEASYKVHASYGEEGAQRLKKQVQARLSSTSDVLETKDLLDKKDWPILFHHGFQNKAQFIEALQKSDSKDWPELLMNVKFEDYKRIFNFEENLIEVMKKDPAFEGVDEDNYTYLALSYLAAYYKKRESEPEASLGYGKKQKLDAVEALFNYFATGGTLEGLQESINDSFNHALHKHHDVILGKGYLRNDLREIMLHMFKMAENLKEVKVSQDKPSIRKVS